jgi:hypothetical protein
MRRLAMVGLVLATVVVASACGGGGEPAAALTPAPTGTRTPAPTASATPAQPRPGVITIYNLRTPALGVSVKGPIESSEDIKRLAESGQLVDFERFVEVDACEGCGEAGTAQGAPPPCPSDLAPSTQVELSDGRYVLLVSELTGRGGQALPGGAAFTGEVVLENGRGGQVDTGLGTYELSGEICVGDTVLNVLVPVNE